jgi:hypothetical protein
LPFATALVGFAAGLASAVFSVSAKDESAAKIVAADIDAIKAN